MISGAVRQGGREADGEEGRQAERKAGGEERGAGGPVAKKEPQAAQPAARGVLRKQIFCEPIIWYNLK